jgi:DNA-binding HxlR family transcriptional regulator
MDAEGGRRYQDLHDALDGISHKVLTETLRRAERNGRIVRHLDAAHRDQRVGHLSTERILNSKHQHALPLGAHGAGRRVSLG